MNELISLIERSISLSNRVLTFFVGGQVNHLVRNKGNYLDVPGTKRRQTSGNLLGDERSALDYDLALTLYVLPDCSAQQLLHTIRDLLDDPEIRCLYETKLVDRSVGGQRANKTDIWSLRRFYRTNPAIMRVMYIANFKTGLLSGKASRTHSRKTTLVS